jgi:general secretion pathway protein A
MYTAFYGLREKPFSLTPDPHFLFLAEPHREALAHVLYGVEQGEGFIAVTGEVGTGKTTLCRTVMQRLGPDTEIAYIFNPSLTGEELLRAINVEFGLLTEGRTRAELSDQINQFLLEMKRAGRRVLLIVDEAQNLGASTLEEIRLLSNLETSTSKLIQILLFGQPELDLTLDSKALRQLRQRISVRWSLSPLTADEVIEYVRHRLRVAAGSECDLFDERALREIRRRSRGIPRLVNLLADRALLAGYATGAREIGPHLVNQAAREILKARGRRSSRRRFFRGAFTAVVTIGAIAAGAAAWREFGPGGVTERAETAAARPAVSAPPSSSVPEKAVEAAVGAEVDEAVAEPLRGALGESG